MLEVVHRFGSANIGAFFFLKTAALQKQLTFGNPLQIMMRADVVAVTGWHDKCEIESLAAPGAFSGTAAVRCDVAARTITGANLLRNGLENVTFTGRQL